MAGTEATLLAVAVTEATVQTLKVTVATYHTVVVTVVTGAWLSLGYKIRKKSDFGPMH